MFHRIGRLADGKLVIALHEEEHEVLAVLAGQVRDKMLDDARDDDTRRLFPPAYADRPELEAEYREMMHDDLLRARLDALEVIETLGNGEVSEDDLVAWLQAANAIRLVLGTRLDVSEDGYGIDEDHPDAPLLGAYEFLSLLVDEAVVALS